MKVALIGYGTMGHVIERVLLERGHTVDLVVDIDNQQLMIPECLKQVDVAIEFTTPATAADNVEKCLRAGVPIVCGTTGWNDGLMAAKQLCTDVNGTFFHASNFSIGVNILFKINELLGQIMNSFPEYNVSLRETHHIHKMDKPSGTADFLVKQLVEILDAKSGYINELTYNKSLIGIESIREGDVAGIHTVRYESDADIIEVQHIAKNRNGFALGAVLAAEYAVAHTGNITMTEMMAEMFQ